MKYFRNNNWRPINAYEKDNVLFHIKHEVRDNVLIPVFVLVFLGLCFLGIIVSAIFVGLENKLQNVFIALGGIGIMVLMIIKIHRENNKIKTIKDGKAYVTEMKVSSKGLERWGRFGSYYAVRINGLYNNNRPEEKTIFVSRVIYNNTTAGDMGLIIRYDGKIDGNLTRSISYVPKQ